MELFTVKGGAIVGLNLGEMQGELTFYNISQFSHFRHEKSPQYNDVQATILQKAQKVREKRTDIPKI